MSGKRVLTEYRYYICEDCNYLARVGNSSHMHLIEKMHMKKCSKSGNTVDHIPDIYNSSTHNLSSKDRKVQKNVKIVPL